MSKTFQSAAVPAAAITAILVGSAMVFTRNVSRQVSPETLAFLRYVIGLAVLAGPVLLRQRMRFRLKDVAGIAVLGIFQFALLIVLLNYALSYLPAAICSLVFSTMPLFTLIMSTAMRRESMTAGKIIGVILAMLGVFLLLQIPAGKEQKDIVPPLAWLALVTSTLIGAVCSLISQPYLHRYPSLSVSALSMGAAVYFLATLCLLSGAELLPVLSPAEWGDVLFIGVSSGIGYFCMLFALGRMEASRVVSLQALAPVTAGIVELWQSRSLPSLAMILALCCVLTGLLLTTRRSAEGCPPNGA